MDYRRFFSMIEYIHSMKKEGEHMKLEVQKEAAEWFRRELDLKAGEAVRLYPRYSSGGGLHPGFSLGVSAEQPGRPGLRIESSGLAFYMEEHDLWYLEGYRLSVLYSADEDDIEYRYEAETAAT